MERKRNEGMGGEKRERGRNGDKESGIRGRNGNESSNEEEEEGWRSRAMVGKIGDGYIVIIQHPLVQSNL